MSVAAVVLGCSGPVLTDDERRFFRDLNPWGFIVFRRNVTSREAARALTESLREAVGRDAPVLVDQEGGRVQRLGPPVWPRYPAAALFARLPGLAGWERRDLVRLSARLMAHDLREVGITVDCAPTADLPVEGAHDVIGDRAYSFDRSVVTSFARAAAEGLMAGGVLPILKHIPGHGRAMVDSHHGLPVVEASLDELEASDFAPFRALTDLPIAMTAHLVYRAIDPERPATVSPIVIGEVVRGRLGYDGLLFSDDLSMNALSGTVGQRAAAALAAGCDVGLHSNGEMPDMLDVAAHVSPMTPDAVRRAEAALRQGRHEPEPLDVEAARARLDAALAPLAA